MTRPIPTKWTLSRIRKEQLRIKQEIESKAGESPSSRLLFIMEELNSLAKEADTEDARLLKYIYSMSALVHHARFGGMRNRHVEDLSTLVRGLLKAEGVPETDSTLATLYGDLHQILGHIRHRQGDLWGSIWNQLLATYQSQKGKEEFAEGASLLAVANRCARLGLLDVACQYYQRVAELDVSGPTRVRCYLEQVRAYRLRGASERSHAILEEAQTLTGLSDEDTRELNWERLLRDFQREGDLGPITAACRGKRGSHAVASYCLEGYLWTRVVTSREWMQKYPTFSRFGPGIKVTDALKQLRQCVSHLDECYQTKRPILERYQSLGEMLSGTHHLFTIDKEMLVWAAALRWLKRSRSPDFGTVLEAEYQARCLRLSEGKLTDVFGVFDAK